MWSKYSKFPQNFGLIYFVYTCLSPEWQAVSYLGGAGFKSQPVDRVNSLSFCMSFLRSSMKYSGLCYNERCYNERMMQRTVFVKIRMLKRTQMLQRTRRNTIGRRSTRLRMKFSIIVFTRERLCLSYLCFLLGKVHSFQIYMYSV